MRYLLYLIWMPLMFISCNAEDAAYNPDPPKERKKEPTLEPRPLVIPQRDTSDFQKLVFSMQRTAQDDITSIDTTQDPLEGLRHFDATGRSHFLRSKEIQAIEYRTAEQATIAFNTGMDDVRQDSDHYILTACGGLYALVGKYIVARLCNCSEAPIHKDLREDLLLRGAQELTSGGTVKALVYDAHPRYEIIEY